MKKMYWIIVNELKHLKTIMLLTSAILGFDFVLYLLSGTYKIYRTMDQVAFVDVPFFIVLVLGTFILPIYIFGYMQETTTLTHLSSLPVNRIKLLMSKYIAGILAFVLPLMLYLGLCSAFAQNTVLFVKIGGYTLQYFLLYYHIGIIAAFLSGTKSMMIYLSLILYILPVGIYVAMMLLLETQVYGLSGLSLTLSVVCQLFPAVPLIFNAVTFLEPTKLTISIVPLYILTSFLMSLAIAYYRHHENVGETIVSLTGLWIIKDVVIIIGSWYVLFIFYSMLFGIHLTSRLLLVICLLVMLFLVNYLATIVFHKRLSLKYVLGNYILVSVLSLGIILGGCHYAENYRPSFYTAISLGLGQSQQYGYTGSDALYKEAMIELHDELISRREEGLKCYSDFYVNMAYAKSNGDRIVREYPVQFDFIQDWLWKYQDEDFIPFALNNPYEDLLKWINEQKFAYLSIVRDGDGFTLNREDVPAFSAYLREEINKEYHHELYVTDYLTETSINQTEYLYVYQSDDQKDADTMMHILTYRRGDAFDRAYQRYIREH